MLITMVQYQQPNILVPLPHDTGNVFLILQKKKGFYKLQQNLLHQRQSDKYSSSKTPRHLPTLFVKRNTSNMSNSHPHSSFFYYFYSLHQTRSCKTYIPSVSHHFQSQIHCSLPHHTHYFISWPSLHVLIKGHNLFNSPLPFVQKTL